MGLQNVVYPVSQSQSNVTGQLSAKGNIYPNQTRYSSRLAAIPAESYSNAKQLTQPNTLISPINPRAMMAVDKLA